MRVLVAQPQLRSRTREPPIESAKLGIRFPPNPIVEPSMWTIPSGVGELSRAFVFLRTLAAEPKVRGFSERFKRVVSSFFEPERADKPSAEAVSRRWSPDVERARDVEEGLCSTSTARSTSAFTRSHHTTRTPHERRSATANPEDPPTHALLPGGTACDRAPARRLR